MMTIKLKKIAILLTIMFFAGCNQSSTSNKPVVNIEKNIEKNINKKNELKKVESISVTTVLAESRPLANLIKATGTVVSLNSVDVRSQMSSVVKQVHFKEGQYIKKGQLLFTLDARLDEANLMKAQAQLAKSNSIVIDLKRQLARNQQLFAQDFIASSVVDASQSALNTQISSLAADEASIKAARVALSYANIIAPTSGRAGPVNIFTGSFVQAGVTALVTITQLDPIAVSFNVSQTYLSTLLDALNTKTEVIVQLPNTNTNINVNANINNINNINTKNNTKNSTPYRGQLQFVDSSIDINSGTVKAKALIRNTSGHLWPGSFVDVQLPVKDSNLNTAINTVVIPQASIIQSARGSMVYTVLNNKAIPKYVEVLNANQGFVSVTGLLPDDRVVLDGKQNLRPNATISEPNDVLPNKAALGK
jgi:RND family efflux transporter MFP subunit